MLHGGQGHCMEDKPILRGAVQCFTEVKGHCIEGNQFLDGGLGCARRQRAWYSFVCLYVVASTEIQSVTLAHVFISYVIQSEEDLVGGLLCLWPPA